MARTVGTDPDLDTPTTGHNSVSADQLRSFVERIERLEGERAAINEDIKEVRAEAKAAGFTVKVITFLIRERKQDSDDLDEFNAIADTYRRALGM